ncbi:MAG TPA: cytochrome c oxidase accessory protein CcoG [Rhodothermales bacterium]|nr:cytochrome c oxidase accessory protein CcoG [Rhodothermales bacterium]
MSKFLIENIEILDAPEAASSTMTKEGKRKWMYPIKASGRFYNARLVVGWLLIVFFVSLPIIKINGQPAVLIDFIHRKFALFGLMFYPTDTFLLLLFMVGSILSVIIGTAFLGRVWCGWGCPQTVYLEFVYRPIERFLEGPEHIRRRRDNSPMTFDTFWRKAVKFVLYLLISFALANVFVSYFVGWDHLLEWMQSSPFDNIGFFILMAGTTALMLFDFGYFREQMCAVTCPYARMQSVLLDKDSMIVSYDPGRGEPRAKRGKKVLQQEAEGLIEAKGDCIDCAACVRTCPTGIDIRDGLQLECIACTQCIDACDQIMDSIGKPRGLVRYTSEHEIEGTPTKIIRPRTIIYSTLILAIFVALFSLLAMRKPIDVNVGRDVGAPFIQMTPQEVANRIRFRVHNQGGENLTFTIKALSPANAKVIIVGSPETTLEAGEMKRVDTFVTVPNATFTGTDQVPVKFEVTFSNGYKNVSDFTLLGPSVQK